jgi:hypothetical protein
MGLLKIGVKRQGENFRQAPLGFRQGGLGAEALPYVGVLVTGQGVMKG